MHRTFTPALTILIVVVASVVAASPGHKIAAPPGSLNGVDGVSVIQEYGAFTLYRMHEATWDRRDGKLPDGAWLADYMDRLEYTSSPFDTQRDRLILADHLRADPSAGPALRLIQFVGPIQEQWLENIRTLGAEPVHYIAQNGYLVWANESAFRAFEESARAGGPIQFAIDLPPAFKLSPSVADRLWSGTPINPDEIIPVVIQMLDHGGKGATEDIIKDLLVEQVSEWTSILAYQNITGTARVGDLLELARRTDVTHVGERLLRELNDEVQAQIMAGNLDGTNTGPSGTGYHAFLVGLGFPTSPSSYPLLDVTDGGLGNGTVNSGDATLHESGSLANPTRIAYAGNCTAASSGEDTGGHGHINTSIAVGYDQRSGFPFQDPDGYRRGHGINPFGRVGGTRIFAPSFDQSACGGSDTGVIKSAQDNGAAISTNSWGCSSCAGSYDDSSQAYDVGVRDADLTEAGNQELIIVFSAGNSGSSSATIGTPGNGKNMITVGASENDRPSDEDGSWTDGCAIGPTGADNAMDVISFSSRGPAPGGRVKPEIIAPGTHIQGTAGASSSGSSVCDAARPSGQTTFASSSGTSHSTPAIAGTSTLVYWWIQNGNADPLVTTTPSPAMMKAYLASHPIYLTGVGANDTLPSNNQGYGMPAHNLLFDNTLKMLEDQTVTFDNSGETWNWVGSVADPAKPVRIVLAYTDAAGAIGTSPQVNDLNLSATIGGTTYLGNNFTGQWSNSGGAADASNNYEAIFLDPSVNGAIDLTVTALNIAGDGIPNTGDGTDQDFAIVCYNCVSEPTFTLQVTPSERSICAGANPTYTANVGGVLGFSSPTTLSVTGNPAGTSTGFSPNPVTPPGSSTLTIGSTGAVSTGTYPMVVTGMTATITQTADISLTVFAGPPGISTLTAPSDGATNQSPTPTFTWTDAPGGGLYDIEVATDSGFTSIAASTTGLGTATWSGANLNTNTIYYWRVRAVNACATDGWSATFSFTTIPAPGDCQIGVTPIQLLAENFDAGDPAWATSGTGSTWIHSTVRFHSGTHAYHADDVSGVTDQYLDSPSVLLTNDLPLSLQFWNHQTIEDSGSGCFDGAVIEYSTNGSTWNRLEAEILELAYDGPVSTSFSSPIVGENAWCGDPRDWTRMIVDLNSLAGQTVQFRFRMTTDSSVGREGWYVDDVVVQSCPTGPPGLPFSDGFESGDTIAWSSSVP